MKEPAGDFTGGQGKKTDIPAQQSMGFNGVFTSAGSPYKGPVLADVEKSIKGDSAGNKGLAKEATDHATSGLKWKRKERDEEYQQSDELSSSSSRKKRDLGGEGSTLVTAKENGSVDNNNENIDGSGMAEAGNQPRRPQ